MIHRLIFKLALWHFKRYQKLGVMSDRLLRKKYIKQYAKADEEVLKYAINQKSSTCDSAE